MAKQELSFEIKLIRLVKATLDDTTCRVKVQNDLSETFIVRDDLKQGDALSCLFKLALEIACRRADISTSRKLAKSLVQILCFADDLDLAGRTQVAVTGTFTDLKTEAEKMGLVINESKTSYMKTNAKMVPNQQGNTYNIGCHCFEVVEKFVYLGALPRPDGDDNRE